VSGQTKLLVDGGVRTGQDILKAMALGADAAMAGRPWVYALAGAGETGLLNQLKAFQDEFSVSMALTGTLAVGGISADVLSGPSLAFK
jgi:L-lactate dehydrogenase (cytochrome)